MAEPRLRTIELVPQVVEKRADGAHVMKQNAGYRVTFQQDGFREATATYVVFVAQFTHGKREKHKPIEQIVKEGLAAVRQAFKLA